MTPIVVSDAGPLIALSRIEQLVLLKRLYKCITVPTEVHRELCCGTNLPGSLVLQKAMDDGWISVQNPPTETDALSQLQLILDAGESAAIIVAESIDCRFLLMDERKGRQIAKRRGLQVVGTAGILLTAKSKGYLISVAPVLNALSKQGYRLSDRLIEEVLKLAGEFHH